MRPNRSAVQPKGYCSTTNSAVAIDSAQNTMPSSSPLLLDRERGQGREEGVVAQRAEQREADQLGNRLAGARAASCSSGFLIASALASFSSNCSVSAMSRRIHSPTRPRAAPIRNGIRQPQLASWSSAQRAREEGTEQRREQHRGASGDVEERRVAAAAVRRRDLGQVRRRVGHLATERHALGDAGEQQQDRGQPADRRRTSGGSR